MIGVIQGGQWRAFGNARPTVTLLGRHPEYGKTRTTPMIPRQEWPELIKSMGNTLEHPHLPYVHDQGSVGQCNADATAAAVEFCRSQQGLPVVRLSPADLYHRINHGVDRGSTLEDAMEEMLAVGIGTAETSGVLWHPGIRQASLEERSRYRVLECWLCPSFAHCMSAVLSGFALISGVLWWPRGYEPDADGWMPPRGSGRPGGHAMMGYRPMMRYSSFGIAHQQSWGTGWGIDGRCVLPEAAFLSPDIGGWWAVRQVVTEEAGLPHLAAEHRSEPTTWNRLVRKVVAMGGRWLVPGEVACQAKGTPRNQRAYRPRRGHVA